MTTCLIAGSLAAAEEEYVGVCCGAELEEIPAKTEEEDSIYEVGGGAAGLESSAQAQKRVETPTRTKERRFFFMITKYSLQK
jgi:hypothetical protein